MLVVGRVLEEVIELGAVRDHAAVIGQTVLERRVVGDGVVGVLCSLLTGHQGKQE